MGFMDSVLGNDSGNNGGAGLNYSASGANIERPVSTDNTTELYGQSLDALKQQKAFLAAIQGQNGIQNQSNSYNQMANIANGNGPNPAQNALNQSTGANVANQAALMAGQRGAGANVGLIARQAAMQGANTQQQAAGQGATLQAQQQMGALNSMANIAGNQVSNQANATTALNQATQSEQQNLLNAIAQQNNASVGNQSSINSSNAGVSQVAAQGQVKSGQGLMQGASMGLQALAGLFAEGGQVPNPNQGGPEVARKEKYMADGGQVDPMMLMPMVAAMPSNGPQSSAGRFLYGSASVDNNGMSVAGQQSANPNAVGDLNFSKYEKPDGGGKLDAAQTSEVMGNLGGNSSSQPMAAPMPWEVNATPAFADGGMMDDMAKLAPLAMMLAAKGGKVPPAKGPMVSGEMLAAQGKPVPGKASVKGNSIANDTVPARLSPGEVVIPRSVMESKDPVNGAAQFVHAVLMKQSAKRPAKKAAK